MNFETAQRDFLSLYEQVAFYIKKFRAKMPDIDTLWQQHTVPPGLLARAMEYPPVIGFTLRKELHELMKPKPCPNCEDSHAKANGVTQLDSREIFIDPTQPEDRLFSTLVHEIGHATLTSGPINIGGLGAFEEQVFGMSFEESAEEAKAEVFNFLVHERLALPSDHSARYLATIRTWPDHLMRAFTPRTYAAVDQFLKFLVASRQKAA